MNAIPLLVVVSLPRLELFVCPYLHPPRANGGGFRWSTGFGFHRLHPFYLPFDKARETQRAFFASTLHGWYV